jgi:hypothetical protein
VEIFRSQNLLEMRNHKDRKKKIYGRFKECSMRETKKSLKVDWAIGSGSSKILVCKEAFGKVFGVSKWYLDELIKHR